jgi:hypothetical protein
MCAETKGIVLRSPLLHHKYILKAAKCINLKQLQKSLRIFSKVQTVPFLLFLSFYNSHEDPEGE